MLPTGLKKLSLGHELRLLEVEYRKNDSRECYEGPINGPSSLAAIALLDQTQLHAAKTASGALDHVALPLSRSAPRSL